jgi:hypothetical protein
MFSGLRIKEMVVAVAVEYTVKRKRNNLHGKGWRFKAILVHAKQGIGLCLDCSAPSV